MSKISVVSVNISKEKGIVKVPVDSITLNEFGIVDDAHAGAWHRQVSLLADERIQEFAKESNYPISYGAFAENISTSGIDLAKVAVLDRFFIGDVELEVTQIGKKCHGSGCAIYSEVGTCIMPKEGIFARVIKGGTIKAGDEMIYETRPLKISIITLSDRASRGEYEDLSGPMINKTLSEHFEARPWHPEFNNVIIPDDEQGLKREVTEALKNGGEIIFTTGGTGIGPRDITPDVMEAMFDKKIPGIMEHVRLKYGEKIPNALISRSTAGVIGSTQVYVIPGSVKAVKEYTDEIVKILEHAIFMMKGFDNH